MHSPMLKTNGISDIRLPEFPNHLFNKHSLHAKCDKALCLPFYSGGGGGGGGGALAHT